MLTQFLQKFWSVDGLWHFGQYLRPQLLHILSESAFLLQTSQVSFFWLIQSPLALGYRSILTYKSAINPVSKKGLRTARKEPCPGPAAAGSFCGGRPVARVG
jgi:hypothetical protein